MLAAINLKNCLVADPVERIRPFNFNERTQQILDTEMNQLQDDLDCLETFTTSKLLRIKEKKTEVMKFNFSKSCDFPPELRIEGFEQN